MNFRKILIADDVGDTATTLAILLKLDGHEVVVATDGGSAWRAFESFAPDTVILDISMPQLSGHEVAQRIRATAGGRSVLLVAVSGWAREQDRATSLQSGFDEHLTKPVEYGDLAALLSRRVTRG